MRGEVKDVMWRTALRLAECRTLAATSNIQKPEVIPRWRKRPQLRTTGGS